MIENRERLLYHLISVKGLTGINTTSDVFVMRTDGKKGDLAAFGAYSAQDWLPSIPVDDRPSLADLAAYDEGVVETWYVSWKDSNEGSALYDSDTGLLIKAVLKELKAVNAGMNLPTANDVVNQFVQLKEAQ